MGKLIDKPTVFHLGQTEVNVSELQRYLEHTGNMDFLNDWNEAMREGISPAEALCSMYAKLCYKSLTLGQNANITKIRPIKDNLIGCFQHGHGSVFEHVGFNFTIADCSRVFTHELVRHRVGTAFSQTSGRYVRGDNIDLVFDPILEPVRKDFEHVIQLIEENYREMCALMGLNGKDECLSAIAALDKYSGLGEPQFSSDAERDVEADRRAKKCEDFTYRKKVTSALRRISPNGQSNEIGFSANIRTIRHMVQIRTSRFAEWEIRVVFDQIYRLLFEKFPTMFYGAKDAMVDGMVEVTGMKLQPYDIMLPDYPTPDIISELTDRHKAGKMSDEEIEQARELFVPAAA